MLLLAVATGVSASEPNEWSCSSNYVPERGLNTNFSADGTERAFIVIEPKVRAGLAPVCVPMTGTVEATNWNLYALRSGDNAKLA